jgi:DNA polymerase bacteriophage-type
MEDQLWLDYESRSVIDIEERGLDIYINDPSTTVLMAAYAFGDRVPKLWEPHLNPQMPAELEDALNDPFIQVWSWNAQFEQAITQYILKINRPISEFRDPMCNARYLGLPGKLEKAGPILGLTQEVSKIADGERLIRLFCTPEDEGGEETLFGISEPTFRDWRTDPKDWKLFGEYCIRDVIAERAAMKKMRPFSLSQEEWETWLLSEKINSTGWPVDLLLVQNAKEIALRTREPLLARMKELTELQNCNSRNQLLPWLQERGYLFDSLGKDLIARALGGDCDLTPECKEVLELRQQTAKSSISKYTALADMTAEDARLRYQYTYYGAHTGRYASHGVNVGNLLKASKEVDKRLNLAIDLVRKMDYDSIVREFKNPLDVAAGVQRSAFRAPEGKKFVWADLASIENRVLGFLARCDALMKVFRDKYVYHGPDYPEKNIYDGNEYPLDPYLCFAVGMFQMSYHDLWVEWKIKGDSTKRTICKPPVLGGGYALGPGKEDVDRNTGLSFWTGLMGYGRNMGVELTQEQATKSIAVLRQEWKEVTWLWKDMERAAAFAIRHPGHLTGVGVPELKWEFDLFDRLGRKVQEPRLNFKCHSDKVLELILPSGRPLFYWSPRVETQHKTWTGMKDGREVTREYDQDVIFYHAKDPKTKQWVETDTFGGHLVENADQAEARDILVDGMKEADKMGFEICGSTYDEVVTLVPIDSNLGVEELCACMTKPHPRYNGELPLAAEGTSDVVYRKG